MHRFWLVAVLALVVLGTLLAPAPAVASDFVVFDMRDAPLATPAGTACVATTGTCTLRAALQAAQNAGPGPHQVTVVAAGTLFLAREFGALTIDGTTVTLRNASGGTVILDAERRSRVLNIGASRAATVTLQDVAIQRGSAGSPAPSDDFQGGGIRVSPGSDVTLNRVALTDNNGGGGGGALHADQATVTLVESTVRGNRGTAAGGISATGSTLRLERSLVAENTGLSAGGISLSGGTTTLINTTLALNGHVRAAPGGAIRNALNEGGVIYLIASTVAENGALCIRSIPPLTPTPCPIAFTGPGYHLQGTLLARHRNALEPLPVTCEFMATSLGDNVADDASCFSNDPAQGDRVVTDPNVPLLGTLGDFGGPTHTIPLLLGSPALDAVARNPCPPPATDQRGVPRPQGARCDVGAFEGAVTPTLTPYPQPNVGVAVTPVPTAQTLLTTLTARNANCTPNSQLQALQFTRLTNATVDVATTPVTTVTAPTTVALPSLPAQVQLTVRRLTAGQPATVELIVTDGCGDWPTLVGGGLSAFGGTPTRTATATPLPAGPPSGGRAGATATPTPTPLPSCTPRPPVAVTTAPGEPGRLQVSVAGSGAGNTLRTIAFGAATNATVEVGGQRGPGGFTVTLPAGTATTRFTLSRTTPGHAATVPLVVTDNCGEWPTIVGGGPTAF